MVGVDGEPVAGAARQIEDGAGPPRIAFEQRAERGVRLDAVAILIVVVPFDDLGIVGLFHARAS